MRLLFLNVFFVLFFNTQVFSQTEKPKNIEKKNGKIGIGFGASTLGFGGSLNMSLAKPFKLKAGYHIAETMLSTSTKFGTDYVTLKIKPQLQNYSLISEIYPSQKSSFHFLLGVIYSKSIYSAFATPRDSQSYGFIKFPPESVGELE
ncbi:MAG: hypothetical protein ACOVP1_05175 [Bacteroidia bacterium]